MLPTTHQAGAALRHPAQPTTPRRGYSSQEPNKLQAGTIKPRRSPAGAAAYQAGRAGTPEAPPTPRRGSAISGRGGSISSRRGGNHQAGAVVICLFLTTTIVATRQGGRWLVDATGSTSSRRGTRHPAQPTTPRRGYSPQEPNKLQAGTIKPRRSSRQGGRWLVDAAGILSSRRGSQASSTTDNAAARLQFTGTKQTAGGIQQAGEAGTPEAPATIKPARISGNRHNRQGGRLLIW